MADSATTGSGEGSFPSLSEAAGLSQDAGIGDVEFGMPGCSRWTISADAILLERLGTAHQTLVSTYPGVPSPSTQFVVGQGTDRLYSDDLVHGFALGPKLDVMYHGDHGYDLEFAFFEVDGWNNTRSVASGPDTTPVFVAPGGFVQTTDSATQTMNWAYGTRLDGAEINLRRDLCSRVTMLAGFRWIDLWEKLQGTIPAPDRTSPFWDNTTRNNLYGLQLGADWRMFDRGPVSVNGLVKAGIFDNVSNETTGVSIFRHVFWESDSTNQAAFLGELDLQCKYQLTPRLLLKIGYDAKWLQGVATGPGQIPKTESQVTIVNNQVQSVSVHSLGIDSSCGVFYHGATAGLEYAF